MEELVGVERGWWYTGDHEWVPVDVHVPESYSRLYRQGDMEFQIKVRRQAPKSRWCWVYGSTVILSNGCNQEIEQLISIKNKPVTIFNKRRYDQVGVSTVSSRIPFDTWSSIEWLRRSAKERDVLMVISFLMGRRTDFARLVRCGKPHNYGSFATFADFLPLIWSLNKLHMLTFGVQAIILSNKSKCRKNAVWSISGGFRAIPSIGWIELLKHESLPITTVLTIEKTNVADNVKQSFTVHITLHIIGFTTRTRHERQDTKNTSKCISLLRVLTNEILCESADSAPALIPKNTILCLGMLNYQNNCRIDWYFCDIERSKRIGSSIYAIDSTIPIHPDNYKPRRIYKERLKKLFNDHLIRLPTVLFQIILNFLFQKSPPNSFFR